MNDPGQNAGPQSDRPARGSPREEGCFAWFGRAATFAIREAAGSNRATARNIYFALCEWCSKSKNKATFDVTVSQIADFAGVSYRAVQEYIPVLVRAGVIRVQQNPRPGQKHAPHTYTLLSMLRQRQGEPNSPNRANDIHPIGCKTSGPSFADIHKNSPYRREFINVKETTPLTGDAASALPLGAGAGGAGAVKEAAKRKPRTLDLGEPTRPQSRKPRTL